MKTTLLAVAALLGAQATAAQAAGPAIRVLSSPAAAVTGGDALVEVVAPGPVTLNGLDVTAAFQANSTGARVGLVTGLREGRNTLAVPRGGTLEVVNHPASGPVFSGPHQTPFVCETQSFKLPDGATLGPSREPDCWAPTNIQYLYKSSVDGQLKPYRAGAASEVAKTTTSSGATVDYVVRLETGVINRAIYQIAVLAAPGEALSPTARPKGWNGRLIYTFGGGCGAAFRQGRFTGGVINNGEIGNDALDQGYALASASLNVLGANCNDVTSAETAMMVKEHFVETFGPAKHTIGVGGSGGSMQQNLIQANYPGVLDGLLPERSYPDTLTILVSSADCPLLQNYFEHAKTSWTEAQRTAVAGYPTYAHCPKAWSNYLPRWISPLGVGCDATAFITNTEAAGAAGARGGAAGFRLYDPDKAPDGVRCGYFDNAINVWGRNPNGSARSPLDNIGVQYGLVAFNAGAISFEQFLDLNRSIGGFDADGRYVTRRMQADPRALATAYATGRVNQGYGMDAVPIIDVRSYLDLGPPDVHTSYTTAVMRARRAAVGARPENFVTWEADSLGSLREDMTTPTSPLRIAMRKALAAIDQWLDAVDEDTTPLPAAEKVARHRPAQVSDACFTIEGQATRATGCFERYPDHADPRLAAGEPLARLHVKCAMRPVRASDYKPALTPGQITELRGAFPGGVCDYTRPPVGLKRPTGTWLHYGAAGDRAVSAATP